MKPFGGLVACAIGLLMCFPHLSVAQDVSNTKILDLPDPGFDVEAAPLKRTPPRYPPIAARRLLSGWVIVEFSVNKIGVVENPRVIDSTSELFHATSLEAVSQWKYSPALKNGKPVRRANLQSQLTFELVGDAYGGKRSTQNTLRKIDAAIAEQDFATAGALIEEFSAKDKFNLYEITHIQFRKFMLADAQGDKHGAWYELRRSAIQSKVSMNKREQRAVLKTYFHFAADTKRFREALDIHKDLEKIERQSELRKLGPKLLEIQTIRDMNIPFKVAGQIDERCRCGGDTPFWTYRPLRRRLELRNMSADHKKITLRCETKMATADLIDRWFFFPPEDWGECILYVSGQNGGTFEVLEPQK